MTLKEKTVEMKNWAVVGASNNKSKFGYKIVKVLKDKGYNVYPVNPKLESLEGLKCYDSITDIDTDIDVVDMVVNPKIGISVIKEIKEKGIKYVWLQPGTRSKEIKEYANDAGISIIEDCIYATLWR